VPTKRKKRKKKQTTPARRQGLRAVLPPPKVHPPATAYDRRNQKQRDLTEVAEELVEE